MISSWGVWLTGGLLAVAYGQPTNTSSTNGPNSNSGPVLGLDIDLCVDIQIGGTAYRPNSCAASATSTVTETCTETVTSTVTSTKHDASACPYPTISYVTGPTVTKTVALSGSEITKIATATVDIVSTVKVISISESDKLVTETETDVNTITSYIVTTRTNVITSSYPYTVTVTGPQGYPTPTTIWSTITTTKTIVSTLTKPVTVPGPASETVTITGPPCDCYWHTTTITQVSTKSIPYTITITDSNGYPVTTTKYSTITTTATATSTYSVTKTTTVAVPTTITTSIPGKVTTITESGTTITKTLPGSVTTITLPGSTVVEPGTTVVGPGATVTGPGATVTAPGSTVTIPASTVTSTFTTTLPGSVTTIIQAGTTVTTTLPGVTSVVTTTITQPAQTVTLTGGETTVSSTVTVTDEIACPKPTNSGSVTPQDTGSNALWGCSPGYVCDLPKPNGCTVWAEPPDVDYLCDAKYCISSPDFPVVNWTDQPSYYPPTEGYFNLNPNAFGLGIGIFFKTIVTEYVIGNGASRVLTTVTTGGWTSQPGLGHFPPAATPSAAKKREILALPMKLSKRDSTIVPSICYAQCNNCFLESQKVGKSPALCDTGSIFLSDYDSCQKCVVAHGDLNKVSLQTYVVPEFAQLIDFCNAEPAQSAVLPPGTSTEVVVPVPQTPPVVVATSTAPAISSSTPPNAGPVPSLNSSSTATSAPSTTTQPLQVTGASPHVTPSSSLALLGSILIAYALSLLL